jgi:hypothetical protein
MAHEQWISDEPRAALVARRLLARALRRRALVLGVSAIAAGSWVALRAARPPSYEATLFYRLAEGDLTDPKNAPRPPRAIRQYISSVALSRSQLEGIMKKYGVSRARLAHDPVAAIDDFRDDIRIEVSRNYFLYDRQPGDAPRSALVAVSFSGPDAERTRAILREIGDAIARDQADQRSERLERAREVLGAELALARERAQAIQGRIEGLQRDASRAGGRTAIGIRAQIAALGAEARGAAEHVLALERRAADVAFTAAAEGQQLGLNLELFDQSLVATAPPLTALQLARLAVLVLAVALALTVPLVGAFDDRIYAPEDLAARGVAVFGALPGFPGDDAGSFGARSRPRG